MILEYTVQDGQVRYREAICVSPRPIEVEVAKVMRAVISRYHQRPCFVRFVITPQEWNRIRLESHLYVSYQNALLDRFMGVPVSIEEDRYPGEVWYDEWTQHLAIDLARPGSERTVMYSGGRFAGKTFAAREIERARAIMRNATAADDVYRRHGGTKRPPSKLHPLVKLDEAIGRDMTKGDTE